MKKAILFLVASLSVLIISGVELFCNNPYEELDKEVEELWKLKHISDINDLPGYSPITVVADTGEVIHPEDVVNYTIFEVDQPVVEIVGFETWRDTYYITINDELTPFDEYQNYLRLRIDGVNYKIQLIKED